MLREKLFRKLSCVRVCSSFLLYIIIIIIKLAFFSFCLSTTLLLFFFSYVVVIIVLVRTFDSIQRSWKREEKQGRKIINDHNKKELAVQVWRMGLLSIRFNDMLLFRLTGNVFCCFYKGKQKSDDVEKESFF
ncbi:T. brucei spp.-specific protein [Trypanosoma brucei gambiense DAL972]|uniref:T. brucei spp.-specific protein n=1 Tax=Trypanosoma brucei gambiense (strain MHOM/CI/86/DAL972) TaxID=679716 RepID=C9ZNT7_TRYB9|nr:T. brucei spp.-specific protein [Trypanosoma brucei gambiense DAL972]CBH11065.1 T. brucei spp.-specific protein [Trypanosoma brucei gambiense DAL972]|eukprot:XP_011773352.1 T. brucei spp.-specific protein [Trypanosoma brucei gambiense DAL972]